MKTAVIDADFIPFTVCHNKKDSTENKSLEHCKELVNLFITEIMVNTESTHYILALTKGRNFRYTVYPQYKANRKYGEKPEHFDAIKQYLIDEFSAVYHPDLEADDIVRICHTDIPDSILISPDKDIITCLKGYHYNPMKKEFATIDSDKAEYNFWCSVITGDSADNIKGIPGKGAKFAERLLGGGIHHAGDVLDAYIDHFGEELGIAEFYKNYKCLKLLDKYEGFTTPKPIEYRLNELKR